MGAKSQAHQVFPHDHNADPQRLIKWSPPQSHVLQKNAFAQETILKQTTDAHTVHPLTRERTCSCPSILTNVAVQIQKGQRGLSLRWGQHLDGNCMLPLFSHTRSCLHIPVTGKPNIWASHPRLWLPAAQHNGFFPWLLQPSTLYITTTIVAGDVLAIFLLLSKSDIFPSPWTHAFLPHKTITFERSDVSAFYWLTPSHITHTHSEAGLCS